MRFRVSHITLALALLLILSSPPVLLAGLYPNDHTGIYIGFGFGYGSASFDLPNDDIEQLDFNDEGSISGTFFVGGALNQMVLIGIETNGWVKEVDGIDWTLISGAATLTAYPIEHVFFRGGPAVGNIELSDKTAEDPFGPGRRISRSESGFGFTFGAGAEFRIKRRMAIVPSVRYIWLDIEDVTVNFFFRDG